MYRLKLCPFLITLNLVIGVPGIIESKMDCCADGEGGRQWRCTDCGYLSTKKNNVYKHVGRQHVLQLAYPCPLCPRAFPIDANLKRHMRAAHSVR
jgi:hypothetical protein